MARMLKTEVADDVNRDVETIKQELEHSNKMTTVAYLLERGIVDYTDE